MKPFTIGKLLSYIYRINQKELSNLLKPYDIGGGGHHSYLKTIITKPGLNQDQLTQEVKFDKATTARCVKQLEDAGYITRQVDLNDRRSYLLYPTEKAKQFEPILQQILHQFNDHVTSCLSEVEKVQLQNLLQKIYDSKPR